MPAPAVLLRLLPALARLGSVVATGASRNIGAKAVSQGGKAAAGAAARQAPKAAQVAQATAARPAASSAAKVFGPPPQSVRPISSRAATPPLPTAAQAATTPVSVHRSAAQSTAGRSAETAAIGHGPPPRPASTAANAIQPPPLPSKREAARTMAEKGADHLGHYNPHATKSAERAAFSAPQAPSVDQGSAAWGSAHRSAVESAAKASGQASAQVSEASTQASNAAAGAARSATDAARQSAQASASAARDSAGSMRNMAQQAVDAIRQMTGRQDGTTRQLFDAVTSAMGMGGSGGGSPPNVTLDDSPHEEPPPDPPQKAGGFDIAGLVTGMVAAMIPNPVKMFSPPQGSEAIIGNTNANVARKMVEGHADLVKGFAKDLAFTPGGPIIGGPVALGKASMKAAGMLDGFSKELLSGMDRMRIFSGTVALAHAQAQYRGIQREAASGAATGGTTAELSDAYQDLQDTVQPIKDDVRNILNRIVAFGLRLIDNGVKANELAWEAAKKRSLFLRFADFVWDKMSESQEEINRKVMVDFMERATKGGIGRNGRQVPPKR